MSTSFVSESECVSGDGWAVSKLQQIWKLFLIKDIPQNITVFVYLNRYNWVWLAENATLSSECGILPEEAARRVEKNAQQIEALLWNTNGNHN